MPAAPAAAPSPLTWIVILNWNGAEDTIGCLDAVRAMTGARWRLAICDNASSDDSLPRLRAALADRFGEGFVELAEAEVGQTRPDGDIYLIRNAGNHGYAGGNNVGVRLALQDPAMAFTWILNNDTLPQPDALSALLAHAAAHPRQGMIGSTLLYVHRPDRIQGAGGARYNRWTGLVSHLGWNRPREEAASFADARMDYVIGAAMFIRRAWLEQVGLMDDSFFLYFEEIDYCRRGRHLFDLGYAPASLVLHKEGGTTGGHRDQISLLADFYNLRNRLRVTWRHFPYAMPTILAGLCVTALNRLHRGQADRLPMLWRILWQFRTIRFEDVRMRD
ncbi:glycosyltransferase family 2 protein [Niveispirillum sp.]|uniref:glycosyltransferase family 2 protein n=1 Tax=Niveispirillum sp. TaxID=1917217 RepID=UPI001B6A986F|nr:glycosyltransferase family 2 protein [Niveispirillum sp.]MBP7335126.1 glycosyltransferase family 2 protein [Niveispirillum sp.]